jgi:hypothetical protein
MPVVSNLTALRPLASLFGEALYGSPAYHERAFLSGGPEAALSWGDFALRRLRYAVLWGHVEGTAYRDIHKFAEGLKAEYDLYEYIRPIFNVAHRDIKFWAGAIRGGLLDERAGDGQERPSSLPIAVPETNPKADDLRAAIARGWRDSNWQAKKEHWARFGAGMGDAFLMVVDDPGRMAVYYKVIHPGTVRHVEKDPYGNVKGYVIEEVRSHPEADLLGVSRTAIYTEICEKQGESIVYTTYLDYHLGNADPYDWRDYPDDFPEGRKVGGQWTEDYGFVPLVHAQHQDWGLGYGVAELFPSLPKIIELDDVSSKLDDAIRNTVNPRYLISGVSPGENLGFEDGDDAAEEGYGRDGRRKGEGRDILDYLYSSSPDARATPLVSTPDIAATSAHVQTILASLERDHPELTVDRIGDNASGTARRVATERIEASVAQRRATYDDAEVRAAKMLVSIGAARGYPGYEAFDAGSFARGELEHAIADRPVFAVDESDRIAESGARGLALKSLTDAGMPLAVAMKAVGYADDLIAETKAEQARADARAVVNQRAMLADGVQDDPATDAGGLQ